MPDTAYTARCQPTRSANRPARVATIAAEPNVAATTTPRPVSPMPRSALI